MLAEMGGTCGTCRVEGKGLQGFWWGNLMETDHCTDVGVDGRIPKKKT